MRDWSGKPATDLQPSVLCATGQGCGHYFPTLLCIFYDDGWAKADGLRGWSGKPAPDLQLGVLVCHKPRLRATGWVAAFFV